MELTKGRAKRCEHEQTVAGRCQVNRLLTGMYAHRDADDATEQETGPVAAAADASDSDSDSDSDDDEDDTAALLRELEKIKRERAEERARQEREATAMAQSEREDEIALGNPLLNLENAVRQNNEANGSEQPSFGVKRRWDDGEQHLPSRLTPYTDPKRLFFRPFQMSSSRTRLPAPRRRTGLALSMISPVSARWLETAQHG